MTSHMIDFIRNFVWFANVKGPVLEIGSYIEINQGHLDLRRVFSADTKYLGIDVLEGPGVDRKVDMFDAEEMSKIMCELTPKTVMCLYVIEHVWKINEAAAILGNMWKKDPESWLFVATHQNQPYHGTDHYGDFWRLTAPGLGRLMDESGVPDAKVFVLNDTSNPCDVFAIRQPLSMSWPGEAMTKTVQAVAISNYHPMHWEQYR